MIPTQTQPSAAPVRGRVSILLMLAALAAAAILAACGPAAGRPATPTMAPSATRGVVTATPGAPTPGPTPTLPNPSPAQQPGADWPTFTHAESGLSFAYPPGWAEEVGEAGGSERAGVALRGPNGFARLETLPDDGALPASRCIVEANRANADSQNTGAGGLQAVDYGAAPQIFDLAAPQGVIAALQPGGEGAADSTGTTGGAGSGSTNRAAGAGTACLILSSEDQPESAGGESVYFLWINSPDFAGKVIALRADRWHIFAIANSLSLTRPAAAQPAPACDFNLEINDPDSSRAGGLVLDEFPVAAGPTCDPFQAPAQFNERTAQGQPGERAAAVIASQFSRERISALNKALTPFGYRTRAIENLFTITKNGVPVSARLNWLGRLSVNAAGTDFVLPVVDSYNMDTMLLRPDGIHTLDDWSILYYDRVFPVFVGDALIEPAYDFTRYPRPVSSPALLEIRRDGEVAQVLSVSGGTPDGGPARGLWSWDGHWVLELPGVLVQDGALLNDRLGYSEMFAFRLFREKPFYFFREDGQVKMSYNGETLPVSYDEVIYTPQALMNSLLQMRTYENGLLFYARRGEVWYYVVLEAVKE